MKDFNAELNRFFATLQGNMKIVPNLVAETATQHFKDRFLQKNWEGTPWQAYKNKRREPKRGSLMMRTNALFNSIRPSEVNENRVKITAGNSRIKYARIHNNGENVSVRYNVSSYNNTNFMGRGKSVKIKAHSRSLNYTMPKRQFMGIGQMLVYEIKTRFKKNFKTI